MVDAVVNQIVDHIRVGTLASGTVLPGERQLATAMRVSRRTIREAIDVLADAGVLSVSSGPAGGTRVASLWIPDSLTSDSDELSISQIFETLEARRVIEMRVAQLASLRATEADFTIMRQTIELQRMHHEDRWRVAQGNAIFHRQLWRSAGNAQLESSMRSIYRRLSPAFFNAIERDRSSHASNVAVDLHQETLDAMMLGDPKTMEQVFDRHLSYLERTCEETYGRRRIRPLPDFLVDRSSPN
ncbi:MAG TPA: FCD domain-containing protein [Microbacteriaceae bacterium]|jgi:DNA-binding FadR family transcriptional regulator|nr:FCD domain-containing protein [Microbacteriaceae bacterium]